MNEAEVRTFLLGAVIGLIVMAGLWWLAAWRRRRNSAPPVIVEQIQLPVANPTLTPQPNDDFSHGGSHPESGPEPEQGAGPSTATETVAPVDAVEKARYHRQLLSLSLELERVEQENSRIKGQWRSSQNQLLEAETGLDQARSEIADIRGIVLQLGATRADKDVIDLR